MGNSEGQRNIFWSCLKNILEKNGSRYWWTIWRPIWLGRWSELRQQMSSFHPPPPWSLSQKGKNFFCERDTHFICIENCFWCHCRYLDISMFDKILSSAYLYFLLSNSMRFIHFLLWQWQRGPMVPQSGFYHQLSTTLLYYSCLSVYSPQSFNVWYQMLDLVC